MEGSGQDEIDDSDWLTEILNSDWFISLLKLINQDEILEPEVISDIDYLVNELYQARLETETGNEIRSLRDICSITSADTISHGTGSDVERKNRALIAIRSGALFSTPDSILEVLQVWP